MTLTAEPATATTSSGALLPLVALPQGELLTINEKNIPLNTDSLSEGVHVKPLRLDLEAGCWVVLATFSPGAQIPLHYHTGIAEVYTMSGSWHYLEYPDQPQTAGSYVYEPAGWVHNLRVPGNQHRGHHAVHPRRGCQHQLHRGWAIPLDSGHDDDPPPR